ncbi:hypothetical protein HHK36_007544 [Tetracentron sinense]|uniref:Replication protein A subunit n=1 Tax=Tetracentron sinense TaxID=13715 RepID=A0A835DPY6_TETSI|nr:hypothetical protein HHK36_007544 [Tetracentron sinense]
MASDGKMKLKAILQSNLSSEIESGNSQNLGLIRILDYTLNDIPNKPEKYLIVAKCEAVSPALEMEIGSDIKREETGIILKPKQEVITKSAAQILHEQHGNMAPTKIVMTRRVHPLVSLNPYQGNWTIKVRLTSKGNLRTYKNARGEGHVFNVELTDEDGTQIQTTMFNEAARKFYDRFEVGKMYYISLEEVSGEGTFIPETKFNFVQIDQLGSYVSGKELVDVIGIVQNVSPTMSIRRKNNNEMIPKRDITIADESKKTVVISLWNDHATNIGQELLDISETSPIVALKSLKVGDFQGVSLSSLSKSTVLLNSDIPESKKLRSWFDSEGKGTSMASVGSGMISTSKSGMRSMYSDRVCLFHITSNPSLGEDNTPVFFSIKAYISFIKPEQPMWYRACKTCNKKVTEAIGSGYWCEGCQKNDDECNLRYIMVVKVSDASGVALVLCQSDPVLNDGQTGSDQTRKAVIEGVRKRFIEKVVTEREDEDGDGYSSD